MILFICGFIIIMIAVGMYISSKAVSGDGDDELAFNHFKAELKIDMCSMYEYLKHQNAEPSDIDLVCKMISEIDTCNEDGVALIENTFRRIEVKYSA